jgi:hypothetical protein
MKWTLAVAQTTMRVSVGRTFGIPYPFVSLGMFPAEGREMVIEMTPAQTRYLIAQLVSALDDTAPPPEST